MRLYISLLDNHHVLRPPLLRVMELYQPSAVVLQCGADSLSGDRFVILSFFFLCVFCYAEIISSAIFGHYKSVDTKQSTMPFSGWAAST